LSPGARVLPTRGHENGSCIHPSRIHYATGMRTATWANGLGCNASTFAAAKRYIDSARIDSFDAQVGAPWRRFLLASILLTYVKDSFIGWVNMQLKNALHLGFVVADFYLAAHSGLRAAPKIDLAHRPLIHRQALGNWGARLTIMNAGAATKHENAESRAALFPWKLAAAFDVTGCGDRLGPSEKRSLPSN